MIVLLRATSISAADDIYYRTLNHDFEILEDEDRREILKHIRTSYVPENFSDYEPDDPQYFVLRMPREARKKQHRQGLNTIKAGDSSSRFTTTTTRIKTTRITNRYKVSEKSRRHQRRTTPAQRLAVKRAQRVKSPSEKQQPPAQADAAAMSALNMTEKDVTIYGGSTTMLEEQNSSFDISKCEDTTETTEATSCEGTTATTAESEASNDTTQREEITESTSEQGTTVSTDEEATEKSQSPMPEEATTGRRKSGAYKKGSKNQFQAGGSMQTMNCTVKGMGGNKHEKGSYGNVIFRNFWTGHMDFREVRQMQSCAMQHYMNTSVDPCENFFNYACGNWKTYYEIPADKSSYDTFEMLRENLDVMLKDLLTETTEMDVAVATGSPPRNHYRFRAGQLGSSGKYDDQHATDTLDATVKAKMFYKSCLDEVALSKRGSEPLLALLKHLGGWPVLEDNWDESQFDLVWLLAQLKLFNNDILISEWVAPDIRNSDNYIIQIDQTTLGLPTREYFLDNQTNWKYIEQYREFIITTLVLLETSQQRAVATADSLIAFETRLAEIMDSQNDRRNVSAIYLRTSIATLSAYFPQFDWLRYFTMVLGKNMGPYESVVCYCLPYLHRLVELLGKTPSETIANYVLWRFVRHRSNNLDERFLRAKQKFYYLLFGREKNPPRWQFCVNQVNMNMGMAVGRLFVKKYFDEKSKNDTLSMTTQLQDAFEQLLNKNEWLDGDTRDYARTKIHKMDLKIGYPNFILDSAALDARYYDVQIHPEFFFENALSLLRHTTRHEQNRIGTYVNKTLWGTPPAIVNAYYSRNKNQIMFPAGILQPPFYHRFFPKSLNFGGIGVVIGHEITHGFDDKGRLFDAEGNLEKWWSEKSVSEFHQRAQCMVEQYNSYTLPYLHLQLDGALTQGENIADNGGLKQAFQAYQLWRRNNPKADESLPGLSLSAEQLFFLNFAQIWCGMQRPESARSRMKTAVHAPGLFRVIGSVSNSEEFAKVYKCPKNSPMNPALKCVLW